ncbi:MAG: sulfurtransferase TusA family protein [Sphingomonas sp.]
MRQIDARGMRCPWPAIRLARAWRESGGAPLELQADDPAAERELTELAKSLGARIFVIESGEACLFRFLPL